MDDLVAGDDLADRRRVGRLRIIHLDVLVVGLDDDLGGDDLHAGEVLGGDVVALGLALRHDLEVDRRVHDVREERQLRRPLRPGLTVRRIRIVDVVQLRIGRHGYVHDDVRRNAVVDPVGVLDAVQGLARLRILSVGRRVRRIVVGHLADRVVGGRHRKLAGADGNVVVVRRIAREAGIAACDRIVKRVAGRADVRDRRETVRAQRVAVHQAAFDHGGAGRRVRRAVVGPRLGRRLDDERTRRDDHVLVVGRGEVESVRLRIGRRVDVVPDDVRADMQEGRLVLLRDAAGRRRGRIGQVADRPLDRVVPVLHKGLVRDGELGCDLHDEARRNAVIHLDDRVDARIHAGLLGVEARALRHVADLDRDADHGLEVVLGQ